MEDKQIKEMQFKTNKMAATKKYKLNDAQENSLNYKPKPPAHLPPLEKKNTVSDKEEEKEPCAKAQDRSSLSTAKSSISTISTKSLADQKYSAKLTFQCLIRS